MKISVEITKDERDLFEKFFSIIADEEVKLLEIESEDATHKMKSQNGVFGGYKISALIREGYVKGVFDILIAHGKAVRKVIKAMESLTQAFAEMTGIISEIDTLEHSFEAEAETEKNIA